jgi:hypothetical protein
MRARQKVEVIHFVLAMYNKHNFVKVTAFWDSAPCSIVEVDQRFRAAYCRYQQGGKPCAKKRVEK